MLLVEFAGLDPKHEWKNKEGLQFSSNSTSCLFCHCFRTTTPLKGTDCAHKTTPPAFSSHKDPATPSYARAVDHREKHCNRYMI